MNALGRPEEVATQDAESPEQRPWSQVPRHLADQISALQKLATSKPAAGSGKSAAPAGPGEHAVAKGETLSGIAKKAGISLKALQDLNPGVDATRLRIGQKLKFIE